MNWPQNPNGFPQAPGFPGQQPAAPAQPGFGQGAPQGQPTGQPPFQQPAYAPQGFPQQGYQQGGGFPQQGYQQGGYQRGPAQNQPMLDLDSAGDEDAEYPKCHAAGGQPWFFTLVSATEKPSFHETGTIVWVTADIRQAPDPAYTPGMRVSIKIGGLGHPTKNNKAQSRLKALLSAITGEPTNGAYAPGHWAGRKVQLLGGQLAGAPFAASFVNKQTQNIDPQTGQKRCVLLPSFFRG